MTAPTIDYVYRVTRVKEVHDGDSFRVQIDQGLSDYREFWIRLRGIDTYELNTPQGQEAQKFLSNLLTASTEIIVQTFKTKSADPQDLMTFARYVADVWVDGNSLAETMRQAGYEKPAVP